MRTACSPLPTVMLPPSRIENGHSLSFSPRRCLVALGLTVLLGAGASAAQADDWSQIGVSQRPSWVSVNAERRLRLLPQLPALESTLKAQADDYFGNKGPGMAVGLVLSDGLFYSKGFGYRDAAKTKVPNEDTVFCIGSFTKVFTATTLLAMTESPAFHVDLDDEVADYVPEIDQVSCPTGGCGSAKLRLRHLVSHTAGLPNEMSPALVGESEWLDELEDTRFNYRPGQYSAYSGVAIELAGLVIKRITGDSYRQSVKDELLSPLGMTQSTFDFASIPADRRAQNWDLGWNASYTTPKFTANSSWPDYKMLTAAGYLLSSVRDLAKFDKIWLAKSAPGGLLSTATLAAAQDPAVPPSTSTIPSSCATSSDGHGSKYSECHDAADFGVGWYVGTPGVIQHNGSTGRCGSNTMLDPDRGLGVTALVSTNPYPAVPNGQIQPAGTDPDFMGAVTYDALQGARNADLATSWQGKQLAVGVARYLWLLGAKTSITDPAGFQNLVLSQFTPAFKTAHNLTASTVQSYLASQRARIGACSTFRVRGAGTPNQVRLRLKCAPGSLGLTNAWDATLTIESASPFRIAAISDGPATEAY